MKRIQNTESAYISNNTKVITSPIMSNISYKFVIFRYFLR